MPALRPLEAEDLPSVTALPGAEPLADEASFRVFPTHTHRLVWAEGPEILGFARLELSTRIRSRHRAELHVAWADERAGAAMLDAIVDRAWRWMAISRLDLRLPEADPRTDPVAERFEPWVRHRDGFRIGPDRRDLVHWGWLAPGMPRPAGDPPKVHPRTSRSTGWTVRQARPEDCGAIAAALGEEVVMWGTLQVGSTPAAAWVGRTSPPPRDTFCVVERDGVIGGSGGVHGLSGARDHVAMFGMSIATAAQGRGAGDALLGVLVESARNAGYERLALDVWVDNGRAEALYRKHGFESEGVAPLAAWRDGGWAHDRSMSRAL